MFLGERLIGTGRGMTVETDDISVPGTIGVKVRLVYLPRGNRYTSYFQTNIPREIWNMEESDILRKVVLDFINPKGRELSPPAFEEDTKNVALRFLHPPQDNLLSLPRV